MRFRFRFGFGSVSVTISHIRHRSSPPPPPSLLIFFFAGVFTGVATTTVTFILFSELGYCISSMVIETHGIAQFFANLASS
ncbi:hypothetical protein F2Q70_00003924 [Brassica cretica]|uniref:Uncharacterized protein n=1 Tax=Brassica cretica TaxID=69181 RepID=A0A8S9J063_BRACR|nr:hypothetical protein F2Q70_00003924 [Brassica cretica]KAF3567850.1 hypothetical protein DY000_02015841 [Brassica cretica]